LDEDIEDNRSAKKMDHGQCSKWKKPPVYALRASHEKEGKTG
jgi:hypothetical protein